MPRLIANTAWSFSGNAVYALCQWAVLIVIARLGNPQMVGQFALGFAIAAPVFLFANLQIRAIQTTDVAGEFAFPDYLGLRILTTAASLTLIGIGVFVSGYRGEIAQSILAVSLMKSFEAVSDIFHGELQRRERMDRISIYLVIKGLFSILAVAAALKLFGSVSAAALWMAMIFGLVLILGEARFAPVPLAVNWNFVLFRKLGLLGLPLGIVMMLISLNANISRYVVGQSLGAYSLGVFAALTYLSVAATTLVNALGLAATPRLAKLFASGQSGMFLQMLGRMAAGAGAIGGAGLVVLLVAGRPILSLIYGAPYAPYLNVAVWVSIAGALSCIASVAGYGMTAARSFRPQLPLFAGVTVITTLAAFLMIPRFGLLGAAGCQAIGALAQLVGAAGVLRHRMRRSTTVFVAIAEVAA